MSRLPNNTPAAVLSLHDGRCLLTAVQAMLKGAFEAEREVSLIIGPDQPPFSRLFDQAGTEQIAALLREHGTSVQRAPTAGRSLTLAMRAARAERSAFALVPNSQFDAALRQLEQAAALDLSAGGALCVVMEDHPGRASASCPRQVASALGLASIEPGGVEQLRDAMEQALRLSRAGNRAVAMIVHHSVLSAAETIEARPNRAASLADVPLTKRRRRQRWSEAGGVLRMARRLELNTLRSMPSPGERVPVGFITIGPAEAALGHLTHSFRMHGRVPVLHLGLLHPLDESVLERFLTRCQQAVVLEPRPGEIEAAILRVMERLRHRGISTASLWGKQIPAAGDDLEKTIRPDEHLNPSTLARTIAHLLHALRPTLHVSTRLSALPPEPTITPPARGDTIGDAPAMALLRRLLADVDQRLRVDEDSDEPDKPPARRTVLAIDAPMSATSTDRVVNVEVATASDFRREGLAALRYAADDPRPSMYVVLDLNDDGDESLERLARASVPVHRNVNLKTVNLGERATVVDEMVQAAQSDALSVVIVRDGATPQYSLRAIERSLAEIDRLGFEPRQWLIHPAEQVCSIRPRDMQMPEGEGGDGGDASAHEAAAATQMQGLQQRSESMGTAFRLERLSKRESGRRRVRLQPLLEQVEVIRTRPPAWIWLGRARSRLELPTPLHATQSVWRMHIAGFRGREPGLAAMALCEAGRNMGYDVSTLHDATPIGAGRRAWAQILFTRPTGDGQSRLVPRIPYGEADVLLGLDWPEALRAVTPSSTLRIANADRTSALVNLGPFDADSAGELTKADAAALRHSMQAVSRDDLCMIEDFAAACRTWLYTDRVADLTMLGAAFQLGLIPVRLDAIETAVQRLEAAGYGRSVEAFQFGRRMTVDQKLLTRPAREEEEDLGRVTRRMVLSVRATRWGGTWRAARFRRLLERCLSAMPGLSETSLGRQARRDMVAALYRCLEWGGLDYATQYGELLLNLYRADRGDKGRALTRSAVLPLAEAMLVRDQVYIACMAASLEQRRRFRIRLNVKKSRGDRVERRYLTRMELIALGRRFRADVKSSDWPARLAKASRPLLPTRWRGRRRDREVREYMIQFVQRAAQGCGGAYDQWSEAMQRLHHHAVENRLRTMAVSELRMLAEPELD